ncbi:MAG TPA: hypothetical protein VGK84_03445, partial [Candidatus Tumulicola sp.]
QHQRLLECGDWLKEKVIVDCGIPQAGAQPTRPSRSEEIAHAFPGAHVVKALNAIPLSALAFIARQRHPQLGSIYPAGLFCSDDAGSKIVIAGLLEELNLEPVDCGPLSNAMLLDGIALLNSYISEHSTTPYIMTSITPKKDGSPADAFF